MACWGQGEGLTFDGVCGGDVGTVQNCPSHGGDGGANGLVSGGRGRGGVCEMSVRETRPDDGVCYVSFGDGLSGVANRRSRLSCSASANVCVTGFVWSAHVRQPRANGDVDGRAEAGSANVLNASGLCACGRQLHLKGVMT